MTEILLPSPFALNPFMGSQSGNIQDLAAYPGHPVLNSEPEPESSSTQEFINSPSQPSGMGLRYLPISATDDVRFNTDSGTANSPVYSLEPATQTSPSLAYPPYTNAYQQGLLGGSTTYSSGSNSHFSPATSLFSMPDIKPRLNSFTASPGMSRSPALPHLASPINTREIYAGQTPIYRRPNDILSRSPSALGPVRSTPLSPTESRSGFTSPTSMDNLGVHGQQGSPPLQPTVVIHQFQTADGQIIRPEIFGKIDKGFFMADNDWTCYRRNYFALNCSYTLHPIIPTGPLHLLQGNGSPSPAIYGFAMSIAAVVDGSEGKSIELVQHTPKRDKGPQAKPDRLAVAPKPPSAINNIYGGDNGLGNGPRGYDQGYNTNPGQTAMEATFERIQFKNATANNGKRRAAQQYYHLVVELYADLGAQRNENRWVKVATRISAPMVVRGRSPGHYQSERRESNASIGPGGSGAGGSGIFSPGGSSRGPGDMSGVGSSMLSGSGFGSSYDHRSHQYGHRSPHFHIPMEPTLSAEDSRAIEETPGYLYYPATIMEGQESRFQLPRALEEPRIKQEYMSSGFILPSLTSSHDGFPRHCGRWEGVTGTSAYFPSTTLQHEMSMT
ncbi:ndt80 like dna-binding family protein [Phlyctema vagabunda]|uniref:Ndt80 like dna-binding family protein n=1 Tax=Phlyctema vagabunda TaxID=108571 RepID=A0ABR4PYI7_9HELO